MRPYIPRLRPGETPTAEWLNGLADALNNAQLTSSGGGYLRVSDGAIADERPQQPFVARIIGTPNQYGAYSWMRQISIAGGNNTDDGYAFSGSSNGALPAYSIDRSMTIPDGAPVIMWPADCQTEMRFVAAPSPAETSGKDWSSYRDVTRGAFFPTLLDQSEWINLTLISGGIAAGLYCVPFDSPRGGTINNLGYCDNYLNALDPALNLRMAIYAAIDSRSNLYPGALLVDAGIVGLNALRVDDFPHNAINAALDPSTLYYCTFKIDGTGDQSPMGIAFNSRATSPPGKFATAPMGFSAKDLAAGNYWLTPTSTMVPGPGCGWYLLGAQNITVPFPATFPAGASIAKGDRSAGSVSFLPVGFFSYSA